MAPPSAQRFSWFLPYLSRTPKSNPNRHMDPDAAAAWLGQFIGAPLRLHASDGRIFVGNMKCTDRDRNIILAAAYEFRAPTASKLAAALENGEEGNVPWDSRFVGLIVVPGEHVKRIEMEERAGMGRSGVVL